MPGSRYKAVVPLNTWWTGVTGERYWLEITDRDEPGDNLMAPQHNAAGGDEWSYSLVAEVRPGDRVLHYLTNSGGGEIAGWSEVIAPVSAGIITWQAHGTRGRGRGAPITGPSWYVPLGGLHEFSGPVTRAALSARAGDLRALRDSLETQYGKPIYFPFFFYRPNEVRARQGYLAKFPAALLRLFPDLNDAAEAPDEVPAEDDRPPARRAPSGRPPRIQDPILRKAIEDHAVEEASKHYTALGATDVTPLGKPYDIRLTLDGHERHVEVKGTSLDEISAVELTKNEVSHALDYQPTDLVLVEKIQWRRRADGTIATSGGQLTIWSDWAPYEDDLTAERYSYRLDKDEAD